MHPQEAQAEPETENAVHDAAAVIAREKVSRKTVPNDSRKSRVLVVSSPHGNAGETVGMRAISFFKNLKKIILRSPAEYIQDVRLKNRLIIMNFIES